VDARVTLGGPQYAFVTEWTLAAPIGAVWSELSRPEAWPEWWPGVVRVELVEPGDAAGLHAYRRVTMKSALPYALTFTVRTVRLDEPTAIEVQADGELRGTGLWLLRPTAGGTIARYEWNVETTKPWMRWLAPIARPIFARNHDVIMRWGLDGLRRRLAQHAAT
jgi:uncharacterized protein YndB with AHSA1/START domain